MTSLKTNLALALSLALAAACVPVEDAAYQSSEKPFVSMVTYPAIAQDAVADGQVHEYY